MTIHWTTSGLSPDQVAHVRSVFPESRAEMAFHLRQGTAVRVQRQRECGSDVPPYAIAVSTDPDFWVDCCHTPEAARAKALRLGLMVESMSDSESKRP